MLCDRVCILKEGSVVVSGRLDELLSRETKQSEITLSNVSDALADDISSLAVAMHRSERAVVYEAEGEAIQKVLEKALRSGATVESVTPKRETLEALFVERALGYDQKRP